MARITIEDCLDNVENMYELVLLTTRRARQLFTGAEPLVKSKNRTIVTALRESGGSFPDAARSLGIHPKYLHRLVRNLRLKSELPSR